MFSCFKKIFSRDSLVDSDHRGEQSWTSRQQIGEDELKSRVITLGQQIESLIHVFKYKNVVKYF